MSASERVVEDGDEMSPSAEDNSIGRLLTLCDGVFAIAMTLLALDLKVPSNPSGVSEHMLVHELRHNLPSYLSFLLSFFVVASYWGRHRRLMRTIEKIDGDLIGQTLVLLFCIAVLPFPAALLGQYGSKPISLVVYGTVNLVATGSLLRLHYIARHRGLLGPEDPETTRDNIAELIGIAIVFALCIPAGFVLHGKGALVLILIAPAQRWHLLWLKLRGKFTPAAKSG